MQVVLAVVKLAVLLIAAPFLTGVLFNFILPLDKRKPGITFLLGFFIYMASFELVAIPCMLKITYNAFSYCVRYYSYVLGIMMLFGIIRLFYALCIKKDISLVLVLDGENFNDIKNMPIDTKVYWMIFFLFLGLQIVMSIVMASFDGDDAYYVVESLLAQQADVMNTILPYTGNSTALDIRHALAVITMWIAYIAKVSGVHATIISHSVIPLLFIPLVYLIYVEIGKIILKDRRDFIPIFMIIVSVLMIFGNVSIYTPATFFLMRTWQGKAMICNLVFPFITWVFLWMFDDKSVDKKGIESASPWILLSLINMFSGMCSAMGVIFGSGLIALFTLLLLVFKRNWKICLGAFLCVVPNFIYLALYFSIWSR